MNNTVVDKFCVKTMGASQVVTEIGKVTKVTNRTIHVDWGTKTWIYQNKDFPWIPLTKEEVEKKYKRNKFAEDAIKRVEALGLTIQRYAP
jgi:hypothetical protein